MKKPVNDRLFNEEIFGRLFAEEIHVVGVRLLRHIGGGIAAGRVDILLLVPPQGAAGLLVFDPFRILFELFVHPGLMIGHVAGIDVTHFAAFLKVFKTIPRF